MKKSELKKLIRECIQETMLNEGMSKENANYLKKSFDNRFDEDNVKATVKVAGDTITITGDISGVLNAMEQDIEDGIDIAFKKKKATINMKSDMSYWLELAQYEREEDED